MPGFEASITAEDAYVLTREGAVALGVEQGHPSLGRQGSVARATRAGCRRRAGRRHGACAAQGVARGLFLWIAVSKPAPRRECGLCGELPSSRASINRCKGAASRSMMCELHREDSASASACCLFRSRRPRRPRRFSRRSPTVRGRRTPGAPQQESRCRVVRRGLSATRMWSGWRLCAMRRCG